jgi:hypothetical protein
VVGAGRKWNQEEGRIVHVIGHVTVVHPSRHKMQVVSAANQSLRAAASRITGNISASQANEHVDVLDDNSKKCEDSSGSGVSGGDD